MTLPHLKIFAGKFLIHVDRHTRTDGVKCLTLRLKSFVWFSAINLYKELSINLLYCGLFDLFAEILSLLLCRYLYVLLYTRCVKNKFKFEDMHNNICDFLKDMQPCELYGNKIKPLGENWVISIFQK